MVINTCMKINEVCSPLKTYIATVRVVLKSATTNTRTTISAESSSSAFVMLSRLYGVGNVYSLSEIVHESPQTDQIQREQAIRPQAIQRRALVPKVAQIQQSQVPQPRPLKRTLSARPIAAHIKHKLIQDKLTKQFMRQSNIIKPTTDDIQIAKNRAETRLKRTDLEFKKNAEEQMRRQDRN